MASPRSVPGRFFQAHFEKGTCVFAASKPKVQICLQFAKVLAPGLSTPGIAVKFFDRSFNLVSP
jgi:hypothetical protein